VKKRFSTITFDYFPTCNCRLLHIRWRPWPDITVLAWNGRTWVRILVRPSV